MAKTLIAAILIALSPALACAGQVQPQVTKPASMPPDLMAEPAAAVVIHSVENMFSGPTDGVDVVSQALLGDNVKIVKREKDPGGVEWVRIETPDTYQGWVVASSLRFLKPGDKPYAMTGRVFVVSGLLANTYREPDVTAHKPAQMAPLSAVLEVVGEKSERWLEVLLPDGVRAWIQKGDGTIHEAPWTWPRRPAADMVALSKRLLGVPYLWGGTSPLGLDCSGLVQLVYKMNGVPILRDAGIQMTDSGLAEVPKGREQAGDLIFFGRALDDIGHVGMMIDAEYFINATVHETPCVRIDRLKDDYWTKIYQAARRPK
jgi:gamma-D-glutamyl-L-lysine dipeptidyl-peptidase